MTNILFATLPGASAKTGVDDYLGALEAEDRAGMFRQILSEAGAIPKAPTKAMVAAQRKALELEVDVANCQIQQFDTPLTDWVAEIETTTAFLNPLDPDVAVEVAHNLIVTLADGSAHRVEGLDDARLQESRKWIKAVGGGRGSAAFINPEASSAARIAEAIRGHNREGRTFATSFVVTGNFPHPSSGRPGFVTPTGTIGSDWYDADLRARIGGKGAQIDLPNPHALSAIEIREAVDALLNARSRFNDDLPFVALLGTFLAVLAGFSPLGSLMLAARGGAGKSLILALAMALLGPFNRKNLPSFVNTTPGVINRMATGYHHLPWVIDDYIPASTDTPDGGATEEGLRSLARRSYDAGSAAREFLQFDRATDSFNPAAVDRSVPGFVFGGEAALAQRQVNASTLDRMCVIEIVHPGDATPERPATIKSAKDSIALERLTESGILPRFTADFLRFVQAKREGSPDWLAEWAGIRESLQTTTLAEAGTDPRHREVISTPALGIMLLAEYLVETGVMPEREAEGFQRRYLSGLVGLMNRHVETFAYGERSAESRADSLLGQIKAKVASRRAAIYTGDRESVPAHLPIIGAVSKAKDGTPRFALNRDATASLLGISSDALVTGLRPLALLGGGRTTVTHLNLMGVTGVHAIVIDPTYWDPAVADVDLED